MPIHSPWPLNRQSRRLLLPPTVCQALARHPLSHELYPQALGYYREAAGHAMHREAREHEDHLLLYCAQGQGEVGWSDGSGERLQTVGPGTLVVLPAGVAHRYAARAGQPWSLFWVHIAGPASAAFLAELLQGETAVACTPGPALLADFQALLALPREGFALPPLLRAASQLRVLLLHAASLVGREPARRGRFDVEAVQAYLQAHLAGPLTLEQLARAFGYERFHFAKTYKRLTGRAPLAHFLQLKMEQAARLLGDSEVSVGEVARLLGYEDPHYFSRQFRQVMGVAPSVYRALKRG